MEPYGIQAFAYALLESVDIDRETANRKILKLSGGEQQRVVIQRKGRWNQVANILVVEDDKNTNNVICDFLTDAGFDVTPVFDGEQALNHFSNVEIDLVILDVMLPKVDGLTVLKNIRKTSQIPVLMLTAMEDEHTQIMSFDRMADDYVTKPFSLILLVKRVKALLRRSGTTEGNVLPLGDVTIDFDGYSVTNKDGPVDLSMKEIELVKYLYKHKGRAMSRNQILDAVWGIDFMSSDRKIDTHVKNIRKKLGCDCITTIRGFGYKLEVKE